MANKNAKKKDYRIKVADVNDWVDKLAFTGLTIAEVYSDVFGACDVMRPTIDKFMKTESESEKIVQFLQVNLTLMDKDIEARRAEERKKEAERALLLQRQQAMASSKPTAPEPAPEPAKEEKKEGGKKEGEEEDGDIKEEEKEDEDEDEDEEGDPQAKFKIPIVDEFKKITPRPLWLYIKDKKVIDCLRSANPPLMMTMLKNAMAGRATTGQLTGLAQKIAAKKAKQAEEAKKKAAAEALAKIRNVPVSVLSTLDAEAAAAIVKAFENHAAFDRLAKTTLEATKTSEQGLDSKVEIGIKSAIDKDTLKKASNTSDPQMVDVKGMSTSAIADEIVKKAGEATGSGCAITLQGFPGTGVAGTVAELSTKIPNAFAVSANDIARALTLMSGAFAEESKAEIEEVLTAENLTKFVKGFKCDKFDDAWDIQVTVGGTTHKFSEAKKTVFQSKEVSANLTAVEPATQGEVITILNATVAKLVEAKQNAIVTGRGPSLQHIDTEQRFELYVSDDMEIGRILAAQKVCEDAVKEIKEVKDDKTYDIMVSIVESMAPAAPADEPEEKTEEKPEEKTEEKTVGKAEEKPEGKAEEKPEGKAEEKPEGKAEEKPEEKGDEKKDVEAKGDEKVAVEEKKEETKEEEKE